MGCAVALSHPSIHTRNFTPPPPPTVSQKPRIPLPRTIILQINPSETPKLSFSSPSSWSLTPFSVLHQKALPLALSALILISPYPAKAGFLSGVPGIESVPGPQIPQIDFLNRIYEENQKKYAESDARFRESPIIKQLLERSKLNKEKNKQQIQDKYCLRGAEWGVGDCSADGMSPEDRESFISMLKKKSGVEE